MNKLICQKCGSEISNDFNHTLSFCTGCGASLTSISQAPNLTPKSNPRLVPMLLGSLAVASLLGAPILFFNFYLLYRPKETGSGFKTPAASPSVKPQNSVAASEITEFSFHLSDHFGPGSDDGHTKTSSMIYSKDGTVQQIKDQIIYDSGNKKGSEGTKRTGVIPQEKFEEFTRILVENDFSTLEEFPGNRPETGRQHRLIIKFSGKTKVLVTGGTARIEAIMNALLALPMPKFEN